MYDATLKIQESLLNTSFVSCTRWLRSHCTPANVCGSVCACHMQCTVAHGMQTQIYMVSK